MRTPKKAADRRVTSAPSPGPSREREGEFPKKGAAQGAADTIRWRILSGRHAPGDYLPGERELSEELGVSRLTLRSALATLESEGLVKAAHGAGTRVLDYRSTGGLDLIGHLAELALRGDVPSERSEQTGRERDPALPVAREGAKPPPGKTGLDMFESLLELRRAIAIEAVGLAAERATPEELRAMRDHVSMQEKLIDDPRAFMIADLAFARMIVRATKNLGFELLFNTVERTIDRMPGIELAFSMHAPTTVMVYRGLLERLEARDGARVRKTAARLLDRLDRTTIASLRALMQTTKRRTA